MNPLNEPLRGPGEPVLGRLDRISDQRAQDKPPRRRQNRHRQASSPKTTDTGQQPPPAVGEGHVDVLA